jgi:hypothetical protein
MAPLSGGFDDWTTLDGPAGRPLLPLHVSHEQSGLLGQNPHSQQFIITSFSKGGLII